MSRAQKITAFDGLSFGSGTNIYCQEVDDPGPYVLDNMVRLVNGAIHDADDTSDADTGPAERITAQFVIYATTAADFETAVAALEAKRTKSGTLTGINANGGTQTCTARLISLPMKIGYENFFGNFMEVTAVFKPKTDWA